MREDVARDLLALVTRALFRPGRTGHQLEMSDRPQIAQPTTGVEHTRLEEELMNGAKEHPLLRGTRVQSLHRGAVGSQRLLDQHVRAGQDRRTSYGIVAFHRCTDVN